MRPSGYEFICDLCGEVKYRRNENTRFCKQCRTTRKKEINAIYEKESRARHKAEREAAKPVPMEKPKFTLSEVSLAARKCNMSYGQYMSEWKLGRVPAPEKFPPPPKKKRGRPCSYM